MPDASTLLSHGSFTAADVAAAGVPVAAGVRLGLLAGAGVAVGLGRAAVGVAVGEGRAAGVCFAAGVAVGLGLGRRWAAGFPGFCAVALVRTSAE
jgi:hypothetical protein